MKNKEKQTRKKILLHKEQQHELHREESNEKGKQKQTTKTSRSNFVLVFEQTNRFVDLIKCTYSSNVQFDLLMANVI